MSKIFFHLAAAAEAAYRHANKSQCVFTDKGRENVPMQTNEAYCTVTTGVVMKRNEAYQTVIRPLTPTMNTPTPSLYETVH